MNAGLSTTVLTRRVEAKAESGSQVNKKSIAANKIALGIAGPPKEVLFVFPTDERPFPP
jgi:hypothetical protein